MFQSIYDTIIANQRWMLLLEGLGNTLLIAICAIIIGTVLGCAFALMKISDNKILIHKTLVQNKDFEWIVKQSPKSKAGFRTVIVPEEVCTYIKANGYAYVGCPDNLTQMLHRIQKRLSLPNFSFHKLRHFYCCFAHNLGIPDVLISKTVGHEHISTTQNIYIHANKTRVDEMQMEVSDKLTQMIDGT